MSLSQEYPDEVVARLFYQGEDGIQFAIGVTCLGDIPVAIRHQLGKVTDSGDCLIGESGGKLTGFTIRGEAQSIYGLVPSSTQDIWHELARMANSFESVEEYNCISFKAGTALH